MDFVKVFKAISDPIRLEILKLLPAHPTLRDYKNGLNVNEITERIGSSRPNVSHHLKILKDAGLVKQEKVANNIYYYKNNDVLNEVSNYLLSISK